MVAWWRSARDEVQCIASTLILAILDVGAPLSTVAFATDAMGASRFDSGGVAVVAASISKDMAQTIWKAGPQPARTVVKLNGDTSRLRRPMSKLEARVPVS